MNENKFPLKNKHKAVKTNRDTEVGDLYVYAGAKTFTVFGAYI